MMGPELLGRLMDEHAAALALYARQWCTAPEDVVQEAFLKLAAQKPPPRNPVPWLYCVVRNGAISALRSAQSRRRHETLAACRAPAWFECSESGVLDAETATAALQTLPIEQRQVIVAHLWGGLTFAEIAELSAVSSSTVHRWYNAGLALLRERLNIPCPQNPMTRN